jgi:uncharacterized repeat protein (TIGR01451 family)
MKRLFSHIVKTLPITLAVAAVSGLAILLPLTAAASDTVNIEGSIGVANVTKGDTQYQHEVNASYDQVVKVQVFYHNRENPDSGKIAENLKVKINIPTTAGTTQKITESTSADNSNTVTDQATVNLDRSDAYLEYIPGSAIWKHNVGTNENIQWHEDKVSDNIVYNGDGLRLEDEKPCYNFSANVTVLARVRVPGIKVVKEVRVKGETAWTTQNTGKPGETLQYQITYKNMGNTEQKSVVIRDNLPPQMQYVAGTTLLKNDAGVKAVADGVTNGGIVVGNYTPGAAAYVMFEVKLPTVDKLKCGVTEFRNVGVARPEGMNEYYNTAITDVTKTCQNQPTYSCDLLDVTSGENRTVSISQFKTTATNGATFKQAVINWGDNSQKLTTNKPVGQTHQYAADGTYTVSAVAHFTVNGKDVTADGTQCTKQVTFRANTPGTPSNPTPTTLVKTGPSDVAAVFAATSVAGVAAYNVFTKRRLGQL